MTARAAWYWARASARRGAVTVLLLALVVAAGAGGAMAAAAGARRTATADDRLLAASAMPEAFAYAVDEEALRSVTERDEVVRYFALTQMGVQPAGIPCDGSDGSYFPIYVPAGGEPFSTPKPRLIHGRFADFAAPNEAVISEQHARRLGVGVGDQIEYVAFAIDEEESGGCGDEIVATVDVVGVIREAIEIGTDEPTLAATYLTPAFAPAHPDAPEVGFAGMGSWIDLGDDADVEAFVADVQASVPVDDEGSPLAFIFATPAVNPLEPPIDAAAVGLWALAVVLGGVTAATTTVTIARQASAATEDLRTLSSLGLDRVRLGLAAALRPVLATLGGVVAAGAVAVGLSTVHVIGVARLAEPDPGVDVDATVLAVGMAGSLLFLGAATAVIAARVAIRASAAMVDRPVRRSRWAGLRRAVPPWAGVGGEYAFGVRRRVAPLPTRSAATALAVATAGAVAVLVFGVGVRHASEDPSVFGFGDWAAWASVIDDREESEVDVEDLVVADDDVASVTRVALRFKLELDGELVPGAGVEAVRGQAGPTVVAGRLPTGPHEIALGGDTARSLGVGRGDTVRATGPDGDRALRVVGLAAFPSYDGSAIAAGWVADRAVLDALGWDDGCNDEECVNLTAISWRPDADIGAAEARLRDAGVELEHAAPGVEVTLISEADIAPGVAAVAVGFIAAAGLLHALTVTVTRRRRELATLRGLGFARGQVAGVIVAEAAALATVGALLGAVAGFALGRTAWVWAARRIGIGAALPSTALLAVTVAAAVLVAGIVLALAPAAWAARSSPAAGLRDE